MNPDWLIKYILRACILLEPANIAYFGKSPANLVMGSAFQVLLRIIITG